MENKELLSWDEEPVIRSKELASENKEPLSENTEPVGKQKKLT